MNFSLRLAFKQILGHKKLSLLFVINLCLGILSFLTLDTFKNSIETTLVQRSKNILTADLATWTRRNFNDTEIKKILNLIPQDAQVTTTKELYTMMAFKDETRLVLLKSIESGYPFYGGIELEKYGITNSSSIQELEEQKIAWLYPELQDQLGVNVNDQIKIGNLQFTVKDFVKDDSTNSFGSGSFAPAIYIALKNIPETGLIKTGSTLFHNLYFKVKDKDYKPTYELLQKSLKDPSIKVVNHEKSSEQVSRLLSYLNDYLGLSSLVALLLSFLGTYYLFRNYIHTHKSEVALLKSLGLNRSSIITLQSTKIFTYGIIAFIPSVLLSLLLFPILAKVSYEILPIKIELNLSITSVLIIFIGTLLGNLLICLPQILSYASTAPNTLFQDNESSMPSNYQFIYLPLFAAFWGLAIYLSHSLITGSLFVFAILLTFGLSFLISQALMRFIAKKNFKNPLLSMSVRNIYRYKFESTLLFIIIATSSLLTTLIPQIRTVLNEELRNPESSKVPSLFLFDIQEDQVNGLKKIIEDNNFQIRSLSPMIRTRLAKINDQDFTKGEPDKGWSREEEKEQRFRNRGFNLTYRNELSAAEEIIEGKPFAKNNESDVAQLSIEHRFASRLNIKLGDVLEFDIQGVPVTGKVVNFRSVRWTSFEPNFFITFEDGFLEEAPKTFLGSIPPLTQKNKSLLQKLIVKQYPNISMIDVSRLIKKILDITSQMSIALTLMAVLTFIIGLLVIYSVSNHLIEMRAKDINLLKVMGAPKSTVYKSLLLENTAIIFIGTTLGTSLSLLFSFILSKVVFNSKWVFDLGNITASIAAITLLALIVIIFSSMRILNKKPALYLNS